MNNLLVCPTPPKVGFLYGPPSLLDLPHLSVAYLFGLLLETLEPFFK
jgi:hypothetical protein